MKEDNKTLQELELNTIGIVKKIDCKEAVKRRLLDLGLIEGTKVRPALEGYLKTIRAYEIRGTLIAIRKDDADNIFIIR